MTKTLCYSDHNEDIRTKGSCDLCGDPTLIYINGQKWEPITESDSIAYSEYINDYADDDPSPYAGTYSEE